MSNKRKSDAYVSDDGFIVDGSDGEASAPKRAKKSSPSSTGAARRNTSDRKAAAERDDNGDAYWELNTNGSRRVTLSKFKGNVMVNIREWYEQGGKRLPGKKGISLPLDQFAALVAVLPQMELELGNMGQRVPRPVYNQDADDGGDMQDVEDEAQAAQGAASGSGKEKLNFEATSSEDED